jgi:hypothetical protein
MPESNAAWECRLPAGFAGFEFRQPLPYGHQSSPTEGKLFEDDGKAAGPLMGEAGQNTIDAAAFAEGSGPPPHLRVSLVGIDSSSARSLFGASAEHWRVLGIEIDDWMSSPSPTVLVLQDENTTGLTGPLEGMDASDGGFASFLRWSGQSGKSSDKGGSHGVGKATMYGASKLGAMFVATSRWSQTGIDGPHVMARAYLKPHSIQGTKYVAYGFMHDAARTDHECEMPYSGDDAVGIMRALGIDFDMARPGTAVAIPAPFDSIRPDELVRALVDRFFFHIAAGRLTADVCGVRLDQESIHSCPDLDKDVAKRLRAVAVMRSPDTPVIWLESSGEEDKVSGLDLAPHRETMSACYREGIPFVVNLVMGIPGDAKGPDVTYAIFPEGGDTPSVRHPFFVRGGVSLKIPAASTVHGYAVGDVRSQRAKTLLGKCENAAHNKWTRAHLPDRLKFVYSQVTALPRQLEEMMAPMRDDSAVASALDSFFTVELEDGQDGGDIGPALEGSIHDGAAGGTIEASMPATREEQASSGRPVSVERGEPVLDDQDCIPPSRSAQRTAADVHLDASSYRDGVLQIEGRVMPSGVGRALTMRMGYKIGNSKSGIRRHKAEDFDLSQEGMVRVHGCRVLLPVRPNTVSVTLEDGPFTVTISGLDPNRALDYEAFTASRSEAIEQA